MKRITILCFATLFATAIFGQRPLMSQYSSRISGKNLIEQLKANRDMKISSLGEKMNVNRTMRKEFTPTVDSIITEAPEGEIHDNTLRCGNYYYNLWGNVMENSEDAATGTYVKTDDAIYILDPFLGLGTDSYLKLDKTGENQYVAHLPQAIYDEDNGGTTYHFYASKLKLNDEGNSYVPDTLDDNTPDQDVQFVIENDTLKAVNLNGDYIIGLTNNNYDWYGFGDYGYAIYDNPYTPTSLPDGAAAEPWVLNESEIVNVAVVGDEFYIQDPLLGDSGNWFKGIIADDKVTFSGMQYLGINPNFDFHEFFFPGEWEDIVQNGDTVTYYSFADEVVMNYDKVGKRLTAANESSAFLINCSLGKIDCFATYNNPVLYKYQDAATTPADPEILNVVEYTAENGNGNILFNLPATDVNGVYIDKNKLYYNLYFDNSEIPVEFTTDTYINLEENMTNVPYTFDDDWDFEASGALHTVYYYVADYVNIGISQSYISSDGDAHRSNIIWADNPASVQGVTVNGKSVKSVNYYDLSGRQVSTPSQGLYIKEIQYADGSKKSEKRLAK